MGCQECNMADIIHSILKNKKINISKLEPFGFERNGEDYIYQKTFSDSGFVLSVIVTAAGEISANVIEPVFGEPYTLHLDDSAAGAFVIGIRNQYEEALAQIAEQCFEPDIFKSGQAKDIIAYVKNTYGAELEFLWEKFPDNAIWRRKDNKKWYGLMLTVSKRKLGIESDETAEIVVLRMKPEELELLQDNEKYFPGYHMNKKRWCTVILDHSVPSHDLYRRIDQSYLLAVK